MFGLLIDKLLQGDRGQVENIFIYTFQIHENSLVLKLVIKAGSYLIYVLVYGIVIYLIVNDIRIIYFIRDYAIYIIIKNKIFKFDGYDQYAICKAKNTTIILLTYEAHT